jgi:peptide-methionine (R)-S-oxide reductase
MKRRHFVAALGIAAATPAAFRAVSAREDDSGGQSAAETLRRSDEEWRQLLSEAQYDVLRNEGTEAPGSSPLNAEKRPGVYACAGCGQALFRSDTKYESGTGWPSFFDFIDGAIGTRTDYKLVWPRTEYHCSRCEGHQGHVFKDGPKPTGLRYCNNGVALKFIPADNA